jgi:magnesium transporter
MGRRKRRYKRRPLISRRSGPGAAPGTLIPDPDSPKPVIRAILYGPAEVAEQSIEDPKQIGASLERWPVTWINVEGLGDADVIRGIGETMRLHRLALEDVVNVHQRAKVERYAEHEFIVLRMPQPGEQVETEQVSMFLGRNFVLTFQEGRPGDVFDPVRERIRKGVGGLRAGGPDHLAYALIDAVVDSYYPMLERYGEDVETLEMEVLAAPLRRTVRRIHEVKRELLTLRRAIWPHRDAINSLLRDQSPLISDDTRLHLRDCYDHTVQIIDLVETYREVASGLMDVYLSSVSNRMNEIMKILTIITTVCVPPTLVAGVYGMNFNPQASRWNMPELNWPLGYPAALLLMLALMIGPLIFFWRRGWLFGQDDVRDRDDRDHPNGG